MILESEELRDRQGRLLGRIREVGGKLEIRDAAGRLKGRYDPRTDQTRDASGRLVGRGNLLTRLL